MILRHFRRLKRRSVHFLHIGKTGGTALKHALTDCPDQCSWLHLHDHDVTLDLIAPGDEVFFFLRDPLSRFVSGFYSRLRQGRPRYESPWTADEAVAFAAFQSADALAAALSSPCADERERAVGAMNSIGHVRDSFWRWLRNPELLRQRRLDILFIGQQEYLSTDFAVLCDRLGIRTRMLPEHAVDAHRNPEHLDRTLGRQARANLARWYEADYRAIELCRALAGERAFGGSLVNQRLPQ